MKEQELRSIANQLSCPVGEDGVEVGNKMNEFNQFLTRQTISKLNVKRGESIVEMSDVMAAEARRNLSNKKCSIEIVCGNCLDVEIETGSIDGVLAVNILYFIDDLIPFFKKIITWMKSDGTAVFGIRPDTVLKDLPFTQYGFNIRSTVDIKSLMETAGFVSIESFVQEGDMFPYEDRMIPVDSVIIVGKK